MNSEQLYKRGINKAQSSDFSGALLDLNQAIEIDPRSEFYDYRSYVLDTLGDQTGALKDLDHAIKLNPSFAMAYSNRGIIKFNIGNFHGAINDYDRALALKPDFSNAYTNRGNAKRVIGNIYEAIDDHTLAIRYNPEHSDAHLNRALSNADIGNWENAIKDLKKSISLFKIQKRYNSQKQAESILYEIIGSRQGSVTLNPVLVRTISISLACIFVFLIIYNSQFIESAFYLLGKLFIIFIIAFIIIRLTPLAHSILCFLVSKDNELFTEIFLLTKVNPNTKGKDGIAPLHLVKSRNMANKLVRKGAKVDAVGLNNLTSLHYAAMNGRTYVTALLVEQGANINETDQLARTPLHYAVSCGYFNTASFLLAHGADINSRDGNGASPLHFAVFYDQLLLTQFLISRGADVNIINNEGKIPLHEVKSKKMANLLINCGADVNSSKGLAASDQYFYHTNGSLYRSYSYDFGNQANVDFSQGATPLHYATESNSYDLVELFIERGANLNTTDKQGKTSLHKVKSIKVAKLLVKHGADINAKDNSGCNPIHNASGGTFDPKVMNDIVSAIFPPSLTSKTQSEQIDRKSIVSFLLEAGADINAKDNEGRSPIFYAIIGRELEVIELLINHGADLSINDNSGKSVLAIAEEINQSKIVKLLK